MATTAATPIDGIRAIVPYSGFWYLPRPAAGDINGCRNHGGKLLLRGLVMQCLFLGLAYVLVLYLPCSRGSGINVAAAAATFPYLFACILDYWEGFACLLAWGDGTGKADERASWQQGLLGLACAAAFILTGTVLLLTVFGRAPALRAIADQKTLRQETIKRLSVGATTWNTSVNINPRGGIDLSGVDLSGVDLHGYNMYGVRLRGTNLRGANLDDVSFDTADLSNADLSETSCRRTIFGTARFDKTNLSRAALIDTSIDQEQLDKAITTGATMRGLKKQDITTGRLLNQRFPSTNRPIPFR